MGNEIELVSFGFSPVVKTNRTHGHFPSLRFSVPGFAPSLFAGRSFRDLVICFSGMSAYRALSFISPSSKQPPPSLSFHRVYFMVGTNTILSDVHGHLPGGKILAIMVSCVVFCLFSIFGSIRAHRAVEKLLCWTFCPV